MSQSTCLYKKNLATEFNPLNIKYILRLFYLNIITSKCFFDFDFEIRTNEENHLEKNAILNKKNYNILFDILTKTESEINKFINDFKIWGESHKPENLPSTQKSHNCFKSLGWASNRISSC